MQLLVSVKTAAEASAAVAGGADLIDAKDPAAGPLGAVSLAQFRRITAAVAAERPVTAALGDATGEMLIEQSACAFAAAGAVFVKVGFAGIERTDRVAALIRSAVRGVGRSAADRAGVVAVAYADWKSAASIAPDLLVELAGRVGTRGVLLDTFDKSGGRLHQLIPSRQLGEWVARAHDLGLIVALAGRLEASDLPFVREAGADIAGVRGAACDGGRSGVVTAERVRVLRSAMIAAMHNPALVDAGSRQSIMPKTLPAS